MKKKGIEGVKGVIDYPTFEQRVKIELTREDEVEVEKILEEIQEIVSDSKIPDLLNNKVCKSCAYYEMCYV